MLDELTTEDIDTLIEAADAWAVASKRDSILVGLMMGMMLRGEMGKEAMTSAMAGEDEKERARKETVALIKAKLIKARDRMAIREATKNL